VLVAEVALALLMLLMLLVLLVMLWELEAGDGVDVEAALVVSELVVEASGVVRVGLIDEEVEDDGPLESAKYAATPAATMTITTTTARRADAIPRGDVFKNMD
jgi:hypothetical protein